MPLRIILRFCVFFSLAAACLLPVGCTPQESYSLQTRAALERLDAELAQKARYQQWRQEQADELRGRIDAKAPTADQAEQVFAGAQVFVTFDLDSSAYYVDRLYRLAERSGSRYERRLALLADIDVWLGRGQTSYAEAIFRKIDTVGMTPLEYGAWYLCFCSVASRRYSEVEDPHQKQAWRDTVFLTRRISVPGLSEFTRARMEALSLRDSARCAEALQLLEPFTAKVLSYPERALLYYAMSDIARKMGDEDLSAYCLAESSISDLCAGTRSYYSLYDLALRLFDRGDFDRAAAYMGSTFDDAVRCKSIARIPNSSAAAMKISEAVAANIAGRQTMMIVVICLAGVFLVVLTVVLWFVLWQHRRLHNNHEKLIRMSDMLREKNHELLGKNDHIRQINGALVDSNRIKDRYVCHYIDLSVRYIGQMDAFRREVCHIAKTQGADELVRQLSMSQTINGEYLKFYQSFDASFLDIFPHFIEQVNELLQPESRFAPRTDSSLTTELRILAALRLGITDSGHIASLLNCASATVYTYRTKLRNAALDRDDFESQVARIGL